MQQISLEEIVKMQPKGLVTIPKKLRPLSYPVRSYTEADLKEFIELDKKEAQILRQIS